jgi:hypothetical protein
VLDADIGEGFVMNDYIMCKMGEAPAVGAGLPA